MARDMNKNPRMIFDLGNLQVLFNQLWEYTKNIFSGPSEDQIKLIQTIQKDHKKILKTFREFQNLIQIFHNELIGFRLRGIPDKENLHKAVSELFLKGASTNETIENDIEMLWQCIVSSVEEVLYIFEGIQNIGREFY